MARMLEDLEQPPRSLAPLVTRGPDIVGTSSMELRPIRDSVPLFVPIANAGHDQPSRVSSLWVIGGIVVALAVAGFSVFASLSSGQDQSLPNDKPPARTVLLGRPVQMAGQGRTFPGTLKPYQSADLFARVSGYLRKWHVDLGAEVKTGQLLAEIDTPEIDQQLVEGQAQLAAAVARKSETEAAVLEARADIRFAAANIVRAEALLALAETNFTRYRTLIEQNVIVRQQYDEVDRDRAAKRAELEAARADHERRQAALATRQAALASSDAQIAGRKAEIERLKVLQGFGRIVAPFDGVVTRRQVEVGDLITAGETVKPLFSLVQRDKLRVQVSIPQSETANIRPEQSVSVTVPEHAGRPFTGKIARTAGAVDSQSRTLLVEVELDNREGRLQAGGYSEVRFAANDAAGQAWRVPSNALLYKSSGTYVAVVDTQSQVQLTKVQLGRDFGTQVEVLSGVSGSESLVLNPADDLQSGELVKPAPAAGQLAAAPAAAH